MADVLYLKVAYCQTVGVRKIFPGAGAINISALYCTTLNVSVPFILRISRVKQNREFKGHEYQLQPKIGISNCMVLIRQNKMAKILLHAKSPTFWAAKLKGFTVICSPV